MILYTHRIEGEECIIPKGMKFDMNINDIEGLGVTISFLSSIGIVHHSIEYYHQKLFLSQKSMHIRDVC